MGELATLAAKRNGLVADLDKAVTAARQMYEEPISSLEKQIEDKTGLLEGWASADAANWGKAKSIELLHGKLGFRTGTPKLKTLARRTWAMIVENLQAARLLLFLRVKTDVDKEAILAAHAKKEITNERLAVLDLEVVQEESFFVEPKIEGGVQ